MMQPLYNDILDSDQFHNDEVKVTGRANPVPNGVSDRGVPFGGSKSTALNAVDFITVDREAAAKRNIEAIRRNISLRKAYEKKEAEKSSLTLVV